jgi:hypothetical protein
VFEDSSKKKINMESEQKVSIGRCVVGVQFGWSKTEKERENMVVVVVVVWRVVCGG